MTSSDKMRILTSEKTARYKTDERGSNKTSFFVSQGNGVPESVEFAVSSMTGSGFDRYRC